MTKPRIYIAIATFHPLVGGAERQALLQGRELRARGYDATVVTLRHERAWPRHEMIEGVPVQRVAGVFLGGRQRFPAPLRKLAYMLGVLTMGWALWRRRRRYDLLHVYQLNMLTLSAAFVCGLVGKPLVVGLRSAGSGYWRDSSSQNRGYVRPARNNTRRYSSDNAQDRVSGDLEAMEQLGQPVVRLTRYLLRCARAVVVVLSAPMKADLAAHGFPAAEVRVIPNGVDLAQFRPTGTATPPAEQKDVVTFVGRLSYEKGVDVLLRAWRIVQNELPASGRRRLIIVGTGPCQDQLAQLATTLGIADRVEFVGLQRNVVEWLDRSSLLVLPSRWEGMPNSLLEAMACALPCVATRVSGTEDVIQHGVNGLLVEPEDDQALAQALLTLLRTPALRRQYGRAARTAIEQHYSLERVIEIYIDLYTARTASARPASPAAAS